VPSVVEYARLAMVKRKPPTAKPRPLAVTHVDTSGASAVV
jgi:hypothetical protein